MLDHAPRPADMMPPANLAANVSDPIAPQDPLSNDRWEYEYDSRETVDYYITLDLTTHVPNASRPRPRKSPVSGVDATPRPHDTISDPIARPRSAGSGAETPHPPASAPPPDTGAAVSSRLPDSDNLAPRPIRGLASGVPLDQLQILDLHSSNPLIAYQNNLYSCHWANALGTDLLYSVPNTSSGLPTASPSLLAATRARLVAKPAVLKPRTHPEQWPASATDALSDSSLQRKDYKNPRYEAQVNFLSTLQALKHHKGETDLVPTSVSRPKGRRPKPRVDNQDAAGDSVGLQHVSEAPTSSGIELQDAVDTDNDDSEASEHSLSEDDNTVQLPTAVTFDFQDPEDDPSAGASQRSRPNRRRARGTRDRGSRSAKPAGRAGIGPNSDAASASASPGQDTPEYQEQTPLSWPREVFSTDITSSDSLRRSREKNDHVDLDMPDAPPRDLQ